MPAGAPELGEPAAGIGSVDGQKAARPQERTGLANIEDRVRHMLDDVPHGHQIERFLPEGRAMDRAGLNIEPPAPAELGGVH